MFPHFGHENLHDWRMTGAADGVFFFVTGFGNSTTDCVFFFSSRFASQPVVAVPIRCYDIIYKQTKKNNNENHHPIVVYIYI